MTIDIDHLQGWIGRVESRSEVLTEAIAARFAATFDRDDDCAPGAVAAPMIHLCLAPQTEPTAALGPDGHPARGGFLPPVPLPRRMWAGGEMAFHGPIRVGERVTRESRIEDVRLKQGRTGPLCFVTVRHAITADGRRAVDERQDIVYRGIGGEGGVTPAAPAPEGAHRITLRPAPPLLFRYSALTFNGHRIHYDADHAREVEGYPGLVVHGPLQATLLVHLATRLRGAAPATFTFRSLSPLFHTTDMVLHAVGDGKGQRLWSAAPGGPVAMEARASW